MVSVQRLVQNVPLPLKNGALKPKAIGHAPKLAREEWCKSNMVEHLEILKEKAKVVA